MDQDVITNEPARLAALHRLELLDTPAEERFDRITRLVSQAVGTPMAALSLIDETRQWFKSRVGIELAETPRDQAFCAHAVAADAPLVVPDATLDERFVDNDLVRGDTRFRFYAGIPVHTLAGDAIGTLCVLDHEARELDAIQMGALQDAAAIAEAEIQRLELGEALGEAAAAQEGLRAIIRELPTAVFLLTLDGTIDASNDAARMLTGGMFEGQPFLEAIVDEDRPRAESVLAGDGPANVRFASLQPRRSAARLEAQHVEGRIMVTAERLTAH